MFAAIKSVCVGGGGGADPAEDSYYTFVRIDK